MTGDGTNDAPALAQADVGVAMNTGTMAANEAGNMVDLDSNPTKLIEIVEVGKQLLITRGALTTFSIANDVAEYSEPWHDRCIRGVHSANQHYQPADGNCGSEHSSERSNNWFGDSDPDATSVDWCDSSKCDGLFGNMTQQFLANVANATNTAVTWTISPAGVGTISSTGLYTSPNAYFPQQTITVTATSQTDPTKSSSAAVTLLNPPSVSVTPSNVTLNYPSQTQQFTATVTNASNTAVTWSVSSEESDQPQ